MPGLVDRGVVNVTRRVRLDLYEPNRTHVLASALESMFAAEDALLESLIAHLSDWAGRHAPSVLDAYLFGSAARGDMSGSSDIDLALVIVDGTDVSDPLDQLTEEVRIRYGSRLNVTVGQGSLAALTRPGRPGFRLWRKILREGLRVPVGEDPADDTQA